MSVAVFGMLVSKEGVDLHSFVEDRGVKVFARASRHC